MTKLNSFYIFITIIIIIITNSYCKKNPEELKLKIIGNYLQQTKKGVQEPSRLYIKTDGTFTKEINLCHQFGEISGNWYLDGDKIILKIKDSDFNIENNDKITLEFTYDNNNLVLINMFPDNSIGCDLYKNDLYKKVK